MNSEASSRAAIALLAYVTLAWGLAWPVTKVAVEQVPIWHLRAGTIAIGGIAMLALARALGHRTNSAPHLTVGIAAQMHLGAPASRLQAHDRARRQATVANS